ncbi:unnamed protein product [Cylindrotheca closterium]|uniref:Dienelactone hydrolase domain-containing protein n=1 Tax=Cylindrotheca closterium TaxID=2856 RepID=A0AAD2FRA6_9STRA|nr:unnamed protein product [Cylindrotheca closterium]
MDWKTLNPGTFAQVINDDGRQIAKDDKYMNAVQEIWQSAQPHTVPTEISSFVYQGEEEAGDERTQLYGHVARRKLVSKEGKSRSIPGVLLFHTGAGAQDVFLFQRAALILQSIDCVVFICDILSDEQGWGWGSNRSRYVAEKDALMEENAKLLQSRVAAAVKSLCKIGSLYGGDDIQVDPKRIAALGWCFGGHPIFELGMTSPGLASSIPDLDVKAMVTFHGVFGRDWSTYVPPKECAPNTKTDSTSKPKMLIFNGALDPFVAQKDLDEVNTYLSRNNIEVQVHQLEGAKHGFSNSAQSFNENPAFEYNEKGANESWEATIAMLKGTLA